MAFDWKAAVSTVAPTLGTMLGGPLAGTAISAILGVFGLDSGASEAQIAKAVQNATPEQLLSLKAEDNRHAEAMEKLGLERDALSVDDRKDARLMQREGKSWAPGVIATFVLACWGGAQVALVLWGLPPKTPEAVVVRVLGMLDAAALLVLYFYFGSSARSQMKDETMQLLAKK